MNEVFRANFEIGENKEVSGVMDGKSNSKKFSCWSSSFFNVENHSNIYGKNHKNQYISLLNCLGEVSSHHGHNESSYSCEIYSHTMILGNEKVIPEKDKFNSISLTVGNPLKLLRNLDSFGYVNSPDSKLINALNEHKKTSQFNTEKKPIIAYFNGDFEVFKQDTKLGIITAHNLITSGLWGGVLGVKIENKVIITIEFHDEIYIDEAFKRANLVSLFFRFIGGTGLFFKDISLKKSEQDSNNFTVYHDSYNWGSDSEESYYSDPLIDVTNKSFPDILKRWFDKDDRENVRYSFYNTYFRDTYSPDRLITAANMFDIFPSNEEGAKNPVSSDAESLLKSLKTHVKSEFSEFPDIKISILQSIGFITRKSLKGRVVERLGILKPELVGHKLSIEQLEFIVGMAIKCRNYFVHGTEYKKLTPEQLFTFQSVFIDTFEYIYAMSELIECGWKSCSNGVLPSHHKIRGYEQRIDSEIRELKNVLEQ